ncbi:hypothetical protein OTU49_015790, partial [Cherax quadricarinatus]
MGRGNPSASQNGPGLVLECDSEGLSDAQVCKIQKLQDDILKLQLMLRNGTVQSDSVPVQGLTNGTVGSVAPTVAAPVTQPLTNGTNVVGLQVPQFLLLQNGQMIAASSTIPAAGHTVAASPAQPVGTTASPSLTQASTVYSATDHAPKSKTSTTRTTPTPSTPIVTRSTRSATNANKNNSNNNNSTRSSSPDIQVLREMRIPTQAQTSPTQ